jgi:hypothetical protein
MLRVGAGVVVAVLAVMVAFSGVRVVRVLSSP